MQTFLDAWLLEAPMGFSQELAGTVKLVPSAPMQELEGAICSRVEVDGGFRGAFWVLVHAEKLGHLLATARVTAGNVDQKPDTQLWEGILRQVAERTAKAASKAAGIAVSITSVQETVLPSGEDFSFYELRFGEATVPVGFADKTEKPKMKETMNTRGMDLLLDIELDASLRFGSREMPLGEVLELGPGDVVQLERHVTDPVDLIVGDKIVARGEVVLVNGNFGLRITEVAEPRKSLESIRCLF
jgi:flagellar motor switch protein FliN/FliY